MISPDTTYTIVAIGVATQYAQNRVLLINRSKASPGAFETCRAKSEHWKSKKGKGWTYLRQRQGWWWRYYENIWQHEHRAEQHQISIIAKARMKAEKTERTQWMMDANPYTSQPPQPESATKVL
jgi:hypothetical protein